MWDILHNDITFLHYFHFLFMHTYTNLHVHVTYMCNIGILIGIAVAVLVAVLLCTVFLVIPLVMFGLYERNKVQNLQVRNC